jgi:hypothetical protein
MRLEPLRYLCAVEAAFRARLDADPGFSGLITKNPLHPMWRLLRGPRADYELWQLADWVDLSRHLPKRKPEEIGLGRNVTLFEWLRRWAYTAVRRHRETRNFVLWQSEVYGKALERNGDFRYPLHSKEVWWVAKSVAKWVWRMDAAAREAFIERQRWRGRKGGIAKGLANEDKRASARLMRAQGMSLRAIAAELGVSHEIVRKWCEVST